MKTLVLQHCYISSSSPITKSKMEDSSVGSTDNSSNLLHVVMFPWLAFGHILPFAQLSNKLAAAGFKVTFISAPGNVPRTLASLKSPAGNPIEVVSVRVPPVDGLPLGVESTADASSLAMGELLKLAIDKMAPDIETLLAELRPHAVLYDYCHDWLPGVASRLGIKALYVCIASAICIAYICTPSRKPPGAATPSVEDMRRPPPGLASAGTLKTFQAVNTLFIFMEFGGPSLYDRATKCAAGANAVIMRSCMEMEAPYIRYIEAEYGKPVILASPLIPEPPAIELDPEWCSWLGRHPEKSVIFCSFGSEIKLEEEQIRELSLGLEMTKMPFILVLNLPEGNHIGVVLPEGFEQRVKGRGMVRTGWVPQQLILGHPSVGCFLNHGGSSSILEGLINGCQLVLLPQRIDLFCNAMLVIRDMGAGVEVKRRDEDGYFGREDVFEAVEAVMGERAAEEELGKRVRSNQKKWMEFLRDEDVHQRCMTSFVEKTRQVIFG